MQIGDEYYGVKVLEHCGGGAFGEVYYCRDASGIEMALKVVSKSRIGSNWEREQKGITFYRKLAENTPSLLRIYYVGSDEQNLFYMMELADRLPGHTHYHADSLAARLMNGPLPLNDIIPVLSAILNGIKTLHEAGYAHRDIKPENILFIKGVPKLADMGLLSPLSGTMTQLAGTLDFMPPEERAGDYTDSGESRRRNDFYAFGKLIYCCITGNGANEYPKMPTTIQLNAINKHFFRLALRLCDREPGNRLNTLQGLEKEFARTVRICEHGETIIDKLRYVLSAQVRENVDTMRSLNKFRKKHGCLASIVILTILFWIVLAFLGGCLSFSDSTNNTVQTSPQPPPPEEEGQPDSTLPNGIDPVKNAEINRRLNEDLKELRNFGQQDRKFREFQLEQKKRLEQLKQEMEAEEAARKAASEKTKPSRPRHSNQEAK